MQARRHLLCTDIARDGMMRGPNIDLYRMIVAREKASRCRRAAAYAMSPTSSLRARSAAPVRCSVVRCWKAA